MMNLFSRLFTVFACLLLGGPGFLRGEEPPASIDVISPEEPLVSSGVIPIPLEVFAALDKLGRRDWRGQLERRDFKTVPDRARSALLFGLAISHGFMAVQAEDSGEVKRIGLDVQRLAGALGVDEPVESRIKIIMDALRDRNWPSVRQELDKTRQTVINTMNTMRDEDLATLVALGGWLGGTKALAGMLENEYTPEGSDLLNQSGLLSLLRRDFGQLPENMRREEIFKRIEVTLEKLEELMKTDADGFVSLAQVTLIHLETRVLVDAIYQD